MCYSNCYKYKNKKYMPKSEAIYSKSQLNGRTTCKKRDQVHFSLPKYYRQF